MTQVVTELVIDARTAEQGSAAYVRAMRAAQAAADRVIDQEKRAQDAIQRQTMLMGGQAVSINRVAREYQRLVQIADPVLAIQTARQRDLERATLAVDNAVKRGVATQEQAAAVLARYRAQMEGGAPASAAMVSANDNIARSSGLARHELINLGRQVQDIGVSLASGQSPLTVLVQQGTQVADVFASSQSTVKGFAAQVMGVITPLRVGMVGLAAAVVTGALAWFQYRDGQREAARSLTGLGRDAGLTVKQLNEVSEAAARAGNLSLARTRETVAALAGTGRVSPEMLAPITAIQRDLGATLAMDLDQTRDLLVQVFRDPLQGAETLNDRVGGLTDRTRQYLRTLVETGQSTRANQLILDTFTPRLAKAADVTSSWAKAWEAVATFASNAMQRTGQAIDNAVAPAPRSAAESQAAVSDVMLLQRREVERMLQLHQRNPEVAEMWRQRLRDINVEIDRATQSLREAEKAQQDAARAAEGAAAAARTRAQQDTAMTRGTERARALDIPERREIDEITQLARNYETLRKAREAAYQRQSDDGGFERYMQLRREQSATERELRERLQDRGRGAFNRDGSLTMDIGTEQGLNALLQQRVGIIDQMRERSRVERLEREAVTADQKAAAAAARERLNAMNEGVRAGGQDLVNARAGLAADNARRDIAFQLSQSAKERIRSANDNIAALRAETAAMGGSIGTQERVRMETQLINDAKREYARLGLQMPQAEIDYYTRLATEMGKVRQWQAELRVMRDLAFEMQQFGRSDTERNVAYQLRNLYGDDYISQMNGAIAAQIRFNEQLRLTTDLSQEFTRSFISDMANGKSATEAAANALKNMGLRLLQMAADQAIRSLFGGLMGIFGGGLGLGGGGGTMSMFGLYANGGAFLGGNVVPFAKGAAFTNSIVDRPTVFPMARGAGLMGEAGPEGVLPLQRNTRGQLGVIAQGGGGGGGGTSVTFGSTTIVVQGNADKATVARIEEVLKKQKEEIFREMPKRITEDRRGRVLRSA